MTRNSLRIVKCRNHHQLQRHQIVPGEEGSQVRIGNGYGNHRQIDQAHLRPTSQLFLQGTRRASHPTAGILHLLSCSLKHEQPIRIADSPDRIRISYRIVIMSLS